MDWIENLQKAIDHCEDNLNHGISLEELASRAGYSVFHFCRLFQSATGCTPGEYLRKRRLSQAAMELYETGYYIRDIGYRWGFNSHENFVRAFRKQFGVSPSQYRQVRSSLNLFHPIERLEIRYSEDLELTPRMIEKPAFRLAGFSCRTTWIDQANMSDIPRHWNRYHAERLHDKIGCPRDPETRWDIGMCTGHDFEKNTFLYMLGVEALHPEEPGGDCLQLTIPAARYAVFNTPPADTATFVRNIHRTWNYINQVWLPQSGLQHAGTCEFETYCEASRTFSEEIWIPVME